MNIKQIIIGFWLIAIMSLSVFTQSKGEVSKVAPRTPITKNCCCDTIPVYFHGQITPTDTATRFAIMLRQVRVNVTQMTTGETYIANVNPFGYYGITVPSCDLTVAIPSWAGKGLPTGASAVFEPQQTFYDLRFYQGNDFPNNYAFDYLIF